MTWRPLGYLTVAPGGLITEANLSAAKLLGVVRSALVKRPVSRFLVKKYQDSYYRCRRRLLETGETQSCEVQVLQNDGVTLWVKLDVSAVQPDTEDPDLRVILSDISERKYLDETLQETNQNLALGAHGGRQGQHGQVRVLVEHEPRTALATECHSGVCPAAGGWHASTHAEPTGQPATDSQGRLVFAGSDQRHSGPGLD